MRAPRLLAAAGLVVMLVSGCGDGTVRAGAAATVGDERITTSELNAVVERGLSDPSARQTVGTDRPAFERSVLGRMIQHIVLEIAARKNHVSVDGATVDAAFETFAAQLGGEGNLRSEALKAGIAPADLRDAIRDAALRDALGDTLTASIPVPRAELVKAYQANIAQYDRVHSAHILVRTEAEAQSLLAQVKRNPDSFAALAKQHSLDTSNKDQGGDLGFQGRGALEKPFENAIFNAKPGAFVIAHTSFGYHVIHVIARRTVTLEQATTQLRRTLLAEPRSEALTKVLTETADDLGVHVNPRFGSWNASTEEVVETPVCPSSISSPSPRADDQAAAPQPTESPRC
jgi:foldase protein PrsA